MGYFFIQRKDSELESEDLKREQLLERNRAAAIRSRARKRLQAQSVQEQNTKLVALNNALIQVPSQYWNPNWILCKSFYYAKALQILTCYKQKIMPFCSSGSPMSFNTLPLERPFAIFICRGKFVSLTIFIWFSYNKIIVNSFNIMHKSSTFYRSFWGYRLCI